MNLYRCGALCLFISFLLFADDAETTHSIIKPRAITTNNMFQHNLGLYWWYHVMLCQHTNLSWMLQVSSLYQRSVQADTIASHLFPCYKDSLAIAQNGSGDVGSPWINLVASQGKLFSSCVSMRPERSVVGAYIDFRLDLSDFFNHHWLDVSWALLQVKHRLHMCQTESQSSGTVCGITDAVQALSQPSWHHGKFYSCTLAAHGVDTVQLKWGSDWFYCDANHISPYVVATVPTAGHLFQEYIFEPILHVVHASVGVGIIGDYTIVDECGQLTMITDLKYRYELPATELRSFDLCKNCPWSRYLKVAKESNPACSYSGINFFTLPARVTPKSTIDWWIALHYAHAKWNVEVGYDFWWRQHEKVDICCLDPQWGIYDLAGAQDSHPVSASNARICQSTVGNVAPSDATFVHIVLSDLNLASGAAAQAISNTFYVAGSYDGHLGRFPVFVGLGTSVELAHNAFSNWACWVKATLSF